MKDEDTVVQGIAINRKNLIEIIVVAILLAFGVHLIASQFLTLTITNSTVTTLIGVFICLISIAYISVSLFGRHVRSHTYEAFFIRGPAKDNITLVPGYELSEDLYRYIRSAFAENSALKSRWDSKFSEHESSEHELFKRKPSESDKLLSMAIEYFLLRRLSFHLDEYFNNKSFKKENLTEYGRKDIPSSVLLSNTFLELFSRPMNERSAFVHFGASDNTVAAWSDGAFYERFRLTLPKGSTIKRPEDNKVEIETKKLKILMAVRYEGGATVLPENFEEYYLNLKLEQKETPKGIMLSYGIYQVYIDIQITVKLRAMLSSSGWEYYRWVDSFLEEIEKKVSREAFFERINWDNIAALLRCLSNRTYILQTRSGKKLEATNNPVERIEEQKED